MTNHERLGKYSTIAAVYEIAEVAQSGKDLVKWLNSPSEGDEMVLNYNVSPMNEIHHTSPFVELVKDFANSGKPIAEIKNWHVMYANVSSAASAAAQYLRRTKTTGIWSMIKDGKLYLTTGETT